MARLVHYQLRPRSITKTSGGGSVPAALLQTVYLDQANSGAVVLAGQDSGVGAR